MGKFVIRKTATGIKFDLKAVNGEVIATSEVYNSEEACRNGIASVQRNAPIAAVEDQTSGASPPRTSRRRSTRSLRSISTRAGSTASA